MRRCKLTNVSALILWLVFALIAVLSIVLISGHGENLIAGYNTASPEDKAKYDSKKMCRVMGVGMAVIAVLILVMALLLEALPSWFFIVFFVVIVLDCIVMVVLVNTKCKKSD